MLELLRSAGIFLWGILRRFYLWAPAVLLDPFDLFNRYIGPMLPEDRRIELSLPAGLFPYVLAAGLFLAAVLTYHEQRVQRVTRSVLDKLGLLLDQAGELFAKRFTTQAEFDQWVAVLNEWFKETQRTIRMGLSDAEASAFRNTSGKFAMSYRGHFNADHNNYLNSLDRHMTNLRSIIERHST